jgi:hypothetical protein
VKSVKKCCMSNAVCGTNVDSCRIGIKRMRMLGVSVRKKALTVNLETVTLISKGR